MERYPQISGFEIYGRLGGGPLTEVYSAFDEEEERRCALKMVRSDWKDQPTAVKLLQREARAGLRARHGHLIHIREAHVMSPPYYLVMDLLQGESLRRKMQRDYSLSISDAIWVTRQTAEALASLHRSGFIHGDVKPENIQIDEGHATLIDLGFAHRPGENAQFLQRGYVLGTPNYLSPELCEKSPDASFSSDIFSLGVVLFEMITGQLPYPPGTVRETFKSHRNDEPADIRQFIPSIPTALNHLLDRLLDRYPDQRPTADTVVQQLIALEIGQLHNRRA